MRAKLEKLKKDIENNKIELNKYIKYEILDNLLNIINSLLNSNVNEEIIEYYIDNVRSSIELIEERLNIIQNNIMSL